MLFKIIVRPPGKYYFLPCTEESQAKHVCLFILRRFVILFALKVFADKDRLMARSMAENKGENKLETCDS